MSEQDHNFHEVALNMKLSYEYALACEDKDELREIIKVLCEKAYTNEDALEVAWGAVTGYARDPEYGYPTAGMLPYDLALDIIRQYETFTPVPPEDQEDVPGCWVAYFSDRSAVRVFAKEVDALRFALECHYDGVKWVPWGEKI